MYLSCTTEYAIAISITELKSMEDKENMEIWRNVYKFSRYQVSDNGNVRNLFYGKRKLVKNLKLSTDKSGYKFVRLRDLSGKYQYRSVHRLVASAFILNLGNKPEVNHIDEDKGNNHYGNLEWATRKENCNHGSGVLKRALSCSKPIAQYRLDGTLLKTWHSATVAGKNGFSQKSISKCCLGKIKTHKGFCWKFINSKA